MHTISLPKIFKARANRMPQTRLAVQQGSAIAVAGDQVAEGRQILLVKTDDLEMKIEVPFSMENVKLLIRGSK